MKKFLFAAGAFLAMVTGASAQATLGEGNLQLNAGVGLSGVGTPFYVGADYGVTQDITAGAEFSYRSKTFNTLLGDVKYTAFGVSANGNYHFNRILDLPSEWDLYAGISLGYINWSSSNSAYSASSSYDSGIFLFAQAGARYFFNEKWGANLELSGGSLSGGKVGVTYKF